MTQLALFGGAVLLAVSQSLAITPHPARASLTVADLALGSGCATLDDGTPIELNQIAVQLAFRWMAAMREGPGGSMGGLLDEMDVRIDVSLCAPAPASSPPALCLPVTSLPAIEDVQSLGTTLNRRVWITGAQLGQLAGELRARLAQEQPQPHSGARVASPCRPQALFLHMDYVDENSLIEDERIASGDVDLASIMVSQAATEEDDSLRRVNFRHSIPIVSDERGRITRLFSIWGTARTDVLLF